MQEIKLVIALLAMEVIDVGDNTLSKAAMAKGMSNYVFTTYTHAVSLLFLIPMALLVHSCACFIFFFNGIRYSLPTLASAMNNLSPCFTFITAIIFRMEILSPNAHIGILKSTGTIISIIGAFILTFYDGLPVTLFSSQIKPPLQSLSDIQLDWAFGALLLSISNIFLSLGYIAKTWIARDYNSEVMIVLISCIFEAISAAVVTLVVEKEASAWTPTIRIELISVLVGALDVSIYNVVITWACRVKGPVYVAMFAPLQRIIVVVMGVFFLGEVLHLGSVIGGTIISLGFYIVMKGKAEEEKLFGFDQSRLIDRIYEETNLHRVPLLVNKSMDATV